VFGRVCKGTCSNPGVSPVLGRGALLRGIAFLCCYRFTYGSIHGADVHTRGDGYPCHGTLIQEQARSFEFTGSTPRAHLFICLLFHSFSRKPNGIHVCGEPLSWDELAGRLPYGAFPQVGTVVYDLSWSYYSIQELDERHGRWYVEGVSSPENQNVYWRVFPSLKTKTATHLRNYHVQVDIFQPPNATPFGVAMSRVTPSG
jgi:hypothetical protein